MGPGSDGIVVQETGAKSATPKMLTCSKFPTESGPWSRQKAEKKMQREHKREKRRQRSAKVRKEPGKMVPRQETSKKKRLRHPGSVLRT